MEGIEKLHQLATALKQRMAKDAVATDEGEHQPLGNDGFDLAV